MCSVGTVDPSDPSKRVVRGVGELIRDAVSINATAELVRARAHAVKSSAAVRARAGNAAAAAEGGTARKPAVLKRFAGGLPRVAFEYVVDEAARLVWVGGVLMGPWTLRTSGLRECGLGAEVEVRGTPRSSFSGRPRVVTSSE